MKEFEQPVMEIIVFRDEDVIAASNCTLECPEQIICEYKCLRYR